jgi:hypothetical protein
MSDRTRVALRVLRLGTALAIAVAITWELARFVDRGLHVENFFSYFTILSNLMAIGVLLWSAARPPSSHGPRAAAVRGAVTLYMAITGIVYAVLLAPADVGKPEPWVDFVIHVAGPLVLALDWALEPSRRLPGRRVIAAWLAFPLAYLVYSLVRGVAVDWYPYPFLDPDESGGYAGVAGYSLGVLAAFVAVGLLLQWWATRSRVKSRLEPSPQP